MRIEQLFQCIPFFTEAATTDDRRQASRKRGLIVQTKEH
jgi:hypothetical protein